jgi:hypothetical protein
MFGVIRANVDCPIDRKIGDLEVQLLLMIRELHLDDDNQGAGLVPDLKRHRRHGPGKTTRLEYDLPAIADGLNLARGAVINTPCHSRFLCFTAVPV